MGLTKALPLLIHTTMKELSLDGAPDEGTFVAWLHLLPGAHEDIVSDVSGYLVVPLISGDQDF